MSHGTKASTRSMLTSHLLGGKKRIAIASLIAAAAVGVMTGEARATDYLFNKLVGGSYAWGATGTWIDGVVPVSATDATLSFYPDTTSPISIPASGGYTFTGEPTTLTLNALRLRGQGPSITGAATVTVGTSAATWTLDGTAPTVNLDGINGTQALRYTVASNLALTQANTTFTGDGTGSFTFTGNISGTGNLTKSGTSALTLSGAHSFTGGVTIDAGTLTLSSANTFNGGVTLNGGTLNIMNAASLGTVAGTLAINGGTLDNTSVIPITTTNYAQTWGGDFTFTGTRALNLGTGTVALGATRAVTVNGTASAGTLTVGGIISGSGFGLTKLGTGTMVLTGANTYSGMTTVSAGRLLVSGAGTPGTYGLTVADNANFDYLPSSPGPLNLTGTLSLGTNSFVGTTFGSTIAASGAATVSATNVNLALRGTYATGTPYTLLTAASGLSAGVYTVLNATDYTYTVDQSLDTAVTVTPTTATALTTAFWKGGLANNVGTWAAAAPGGAGSNWATSTSGAALTSVVPGSSTDVTIGGVAGQSSMTTMILGTDMSINKLTIGGGSAVTLNATYGHTLTIGAGGLLVSAGGTSVNPTLNATLIPAGDQTWQYTATSSNAALTIADIGAGGSGVLTLRNTGNKTFTIGSVNHDGSIANTGTAGLTITGSVGPNLVNIEQNGAGQMTISGPISGTTTVTITSGALQLSGVNTFSGGITVNSGGTFLPFSTKALGSGTLTLNTGAIVAGQQNVGNITVAGDQLWNGNWTYNTSGTSTNSLAFGTGTVTLGGGVQVTANSLITFGGAIALGANNLTKAGAGEMILNGAIGGSGSVIVNDGTLTLGGASPSLSGGVTVNSLGTLKFNGNSGLGAGALVINTGANIRTGTNSALGVSGVTPQTWNGDFTFTGGGGSSSTTFGTGTITLGGNVQLTDNNTLTYGGDVVLGTNSFTKAGAASLTFNGAVSGSGLITLSAGTLALGGANTSFTGGITISAGTLLSIKNANALGTSAGTLTINGGTIDNLSGVNLTNLGNNPQAWNASFVFTGSKNLDLGTGDVTLSTSPTVTVSANTLTVGGAISGATFGLTKAGAGTLALNGTSSYSGITTVSLGTLSVAVLADGGSNSSIGSSTNAAANLVFATGTTLVYTGAGSSTNRQFTIGGPFTLDASGSGAVNFTDAAAMTMPGTNSALLVTLTGTNTGGNTFGGAIGNNGSGVTSVTKANSGTWVLAGTSTYTGLTTISVGTLKLGATGTGANTPLGTVALGTTVSATGAALDLNGFTLTTSEALTLNGTGVGSAGALTNSGAEATYSGLITLGSASTIGGSGNIIVSNTGTITGATFGLTLSGTATGSSIASIIGTTSGTLTKSGTGTWTVSGNNTYTGLTTISAGTLKLGSAGSGANTPLGTTGAGTTVSATGTLDLNGFTLATTEALTLNGSGTSNSGALANSSSTAATYSGLITLGSASRIVAGSGNIIVSNAGTITGATFGLTLDGAATGSSIASIIGTTSGTVTKTGTGTWTVSGSNTYTGLTTISDGTLKLGAAGGATNTPLGTTGAGTTVSGTGTLDLNGFTLGTAEALTLSSSGTSNSGALANSSGTAATYSGLITLGGASRIVASNGNIVISNTGTITGATFGLTLDGTAFGSSVASIIGTTSGSLTKTGTGTWTLSGANTYSGGTTVNGGTLTVSGASATLGATTGTLTVSNPNTGAGTAVVLNLSTTADTTVGTLSGAIATPSSSTNTATINVGSRLLTVNQTSAGTYAGVINSTGGFTLGSLSTNTLVLSGLNTYTGVTTIAAGTLSVGSINSVSSGNPSNMGAPNSVANGTIKMGSGTAYGTLVYTGTGETTDRNILLVNGSGINGGGKIDQSGTSLLKFTGSVGPDTTNTKDLTLQGSTSGTGEISGVIANNGAVAMSVTKAGTGTWTLSGNNSYTGLTTINAGKLMLGAAGDGTNGPLGTIGAGTAVNTGGALDLNGITLSTAEALTIKGTGISSGGALTNTSATAATYSGLIRVDSAGSIIANNGNIIITNTGQITSSFVAQLVLGGTAPDCQIYSGIDQAGASSFLKTGTGTWTLYGALGDSATVEGGTFTIGAGGSLASTQTLTVNNPNIGAGTDVVVNLSETANTTITGLAGTIATPSSGTNTATVNIRGARTLTMNGNGTFPGVIGGDGNLVMNGSGTSALTGANTYSGTTTIGNNGTMTVTKINSVFSGTYVDPSSTLGAPTTALNGIITLGSGNIFGTLLYTGSGETTDRGIALTPGQNSSGGGGGIIDQSGTGVLKFTSNVTGTSRSRSLVLQGSTDGTGEIAGAIVTGSGTLSLTKAGTGTWVLSNVNTYTGATTVSGGILDVTGSINGTSGLSVANGAQAFFDSGLQKATATVSIEDGGKVTMRATSPNLGSGWPGGAGAAVSVVGGLTLTGTAQLDLYNNDLVINYTTGGSALFTTIDDAVRTGYAGGAWNGTGINSTTAGQLNYFTLLVLDTADTNDNYQPGSGGPTVDATTIVVKFTHQDDLNGDGSVTAADKAIFTSHWSDGGTGATHRFGDMDFDGVYTFNDVQLFNLYYNTALPSLPEPGSLALLALGAAGLLARKRR